ncbi:MAG: hypothetical protein UU76_C0001G0030 [Parcubacteria group bacterium GW2011_GWC1_41_7]|nr:MAG: hypothetical protein UU76_C0001G0030 [Parcubacteria group bacterium GW2011_GWC1_41_7]
MNANIQMSIIVVGFVVLYIALKKQFSEKKDDSQSFVLLQNQINEITRMLDTRLGESAKIFQVQSIESSKINRELIEKLAQLEKTSGQVVGFADQLKNLQDILQNPKQRGILGEYYLKTVLENVLPPGSFQMQYEFLNGDIVDAVIFIKDRIIPVDSKFSLENYNRILDERDVGARDQLEKAFKQDLKNRIDETAKYVKPSEGTMDFAFMFIPSEAIYYDLLVNRIGSIKSNTQDLIQYAFKDKHVIIVSPTSFLAYLQTVLQGLKALQIEESAKEIRKRVEELGRHLISYEVYFKKLGNNLGTTVNMYNSAYKEFGKIDKDVLRISGETIGVEAIILDRPHEED